MYSFSGQWYSSTQLENGFNTANIATAAYGSRTCLGLSGATSAWGQIGFALRPQPSVTASTAARKMAAIFRLRFATETLAVAAGSQQKIAMLQLTDYTETSGSRVDAEVYVYNDGGTYKVKIYFNDYGGTPAWSGYLGTVTAGTTFYKLELYCYLNKVSCYWDDVFIEDVTYSAAKTDHRANSVYLYFENTLAVWHLDDMWVGHEEVDFSTAAGRSTTNGSPDDGTLYLIKSSVITAAIAAGDAWELAIGDGSYTGAPTDEDDYLVAKVLDGNDGGFALKLAYSASAGWVKSEWSL